MFAIEQNANNSPLYNYNIIVPGIFNYEQTGRHCLEAQDSEFENAIA